MGNDLKRYLRIGYFLICLTAIIAVSAQQVSLKKQHGFKYKKMLSIFDSLNIQEPDFDKVTLELRVLRIVWSNDRPNSVLWQIRKDRNEQWTGVSYQFFFYNSEHYDFKNIKTFPLHFKDTWQNTWDNILRNDYLNIPDEKGIKIECKKDDGLMLAIGDGESYAVEVLTKKIKRRIWFSNPETKYKFYEEEYNLDCTGLDNYENFIAFMKLLEQEFSD